GGEGHQGQHRHAHADHRGDDRDDRGDQRAEHDREDDQRDDDADDLAGAEGDVRALQHLDAAVRVQRGGVGLVDEVTDLLDGLGGVDAGGEVHLELGDDGGVVVRAGAGGEVVEGGRGDGDVLDLADLGHQRIDLVLVLIDRGAVLGDEHHLPGGASHLREAGGQGVDTALTLCAGDLDVGGEGAA